MPDCGSASSVRAWLCAATRRLGVVGPCCLAVVLGFSAVPVDAAQVSGQFNVTVTQQSGNVPPLNNTGFCILGPGRDTFDAIVTVVCATGTVVNLAAPRTATAWTQIHGGAYRYTHIEAYELASPGGLDGIESYTGVGTSTSWRMVSLADRDYLELQIGW